MSEQKNESPPNRIGLVISGLLAGILLTLWFGGVFSVDLFPDEVVRRVELGSDVTAGNVSIPDSEVPTQYLDVMSMNEVFKAVSAKVTPAVVYIQVESGLDQSILSPLRRSPQRRPSQSLGSGVIISDQGYIVTNNHVIDGADKIQVMLGDKREFEARVIGADPTTDLAVIKINPRSPIPVIALGKAGDIAVGEWVLAVGNPFRLTSTVTAGIVSALGRQVDVINQQLGIESFIQTDAAINPGNSGGAVVNLRGELVGIATAIATETGSYEGYGFAVPVALMERVVRDLILFGEVRRGYLGVSIGSMTAGRAAHLGLDSIRGVYLSDVHSGLAGYQGGLRDGDVLLSIGGRPMSEPNELQSAIALFSPGDEISVEVWRRSEVLHFEVMLKGTDDPAYTTWLAELNTERDQQLFPVPPIPDDMIADFEDWGVGVANLDERLRRRFNIQHGVLVAFIERQGLFDRAGVERGLVITNVNDKPVFNVNTIRELFSTSDEVLIRAISPNGDIVFFEVSQ